MSLPPARRQSLPPRPLHARRLATRTTLRMAMRRMRRRVTRPLPLWQKMIIVAWHRARLAVLSPGGCGATDPVSEYDNYRETIAAITTARHHAPRNAYSRAKAYRYTEHIGPRCSAAGTSSLAASRASLRHAGSRTTYFCAAARRIVQRARAAIADGCQVQRACSAAQQQQFAQSNAMRQHS